MGALKDVTGAVMPYAILGGIALAIYIKRDAIVNWFKGAVIPDSLTTDTNGDNINDAGTGVIDVNKPLWEGSLFNQLLNDIKGFFGGSPGAIDTTVPGTTPGVLSDAPGVQTLIIPADQVSTWANPTARDPITTPGYQAALEGTSNLVTGSASEAYANAQAIRSAAALPPSSGWNFQTIKPLIEPDGYTEMQLSPVLALGINQYGWDVHYTEDVGPWHEGQITKMTSGGINPFGSSAFDLYLKQAVQYSGAV